MKTRMWKAELRGCCFFRGTACHRLIAYTLNQPLLLIREPDNPIDVNAIKVADVLGIESAYIAREVAAEVAPLMDSGIIVLAKIIATVQQVGFHLRSPVALLWTKEEEERKEEERRKPLPLKLETIE